MSCDSAKLGSRGEYINTMVLIHFLNESSTYITQLAFHDIMWQCYALQVDRQIYLNPNKKSWRKSCNSLKSRLHRENRYHCKVNRLTGLLISLLSPQRALNGSVWHQTQKQIATLFYQLVSHILSLVTPSLIQCGKTLFVEAVSHTQHAYPIATSQVDDFRTPIDDCSVALSSTSRGICRAATFSMFIFLHTHTGFCVQFLWVEICTALI